jgi:hypothetical protein
MMQLQPLRDSEEGMPQVKLTWGLVAFDSSQPYLSRTQVDSSPFAICDESYQVG